MGIEIDLLYEREMGIKYLLEFGAKGVADIAVFSREIEEHSCFDSDSVL